jgi:hypothetical protein
MDLTMGEVPEQGPCASGGPAPCAGSHPTRRAKGSSGVQASCNLVSPVISMSGLPARSTFQVGTRP